MKDELLVKLAEIGNLLTEATCEGVKLTEANEVMEILGQLEQAVDYYVD
jgi:hypothetical protein